MKNRKEYDSIGRINVPVDKYWGASTQRSCPLDGVTLDIASCDLRDHLPYLAHDRCHSDLLVHLIAEVISLHTSKYFVSVYSKFQFCVYLKWEEIQINI